MADPRDGIAAGTTPDVVPVTAAALRPDDPTVAGDGGTVHNLHDRRHDLHALRWARRPGMPAFPRRTQSPENP